MFENRKFELEMNFDILLDKKILEAHKIKVLNKLMREFLFHTVEEKEIFLFQIRRLFFLNTKRYIEVVVK